MNRAFPFLVIVVLVAVVLRPTVVLVAAGLGLAAFGGWWVWRAIQARDTTYRPPAPPPTQAFPGGTVWHRHKPHAGQPPFKPSAAFPSMVHGWIDYHDDGANHDTRPLAALYGPQNATLVWCLTTDGLGAAILVPLAADKEQAVTQAERVADAVERGGDHDLAARLWAVTQDIGPSEQAMRRARRCQLLVGSGV